MTQKIKKIFLPAILFLIVIGYLFLPYLSLAAELIDPLNLGEGGPEVLVGRVITAILGLVGVLALVMFIVGGIMWMTSGGSAEKVKKGKDTIVWAVFGLVFIFFSYAILNFILRVLMNKPE